MRKYGRQILTALLAVALLGLGLDIRYGLFSGRGRRLPVLMYHHFSDGPEPGATVTGGRFREQMAALRDAGFQTVTLPQVRDYVYSGAPLPEKPVLITMDDGYASNLAIAAPVLEEMGFCATVFMIGCYEGEVLDYRSGNYIWEERFSYEQALPWVEKGVLDLQSHSFDMHRLIEEGIGQRDGMLREEGETGGAYAAAIAEDVRQFRARREGRAPTAFMALSFPYGYWTHELDGLLEQEGIDFTFTTISCGNRLDIGRPECLRVLGRFNVDDSCSGEKLVRRLERVLRGGA